MDKNESRLSQPRTLAQYLRLYLTGFAMGAADVVPGVSGGTMAFILGIYSTLINTIRSFNLTALRMLLNRRIGDLLTHVRLTFLLPLVLGGVSAVLLLSGFLTGVLDDEQGRALLFAFFFGLVVASIVTIGAKVRWNAAALATFAVGTVVAFVLVNLVPAEVEHSLPVLFFSGTIAISAMILPGISGSFILLILGQYDYVLTAVSNRDLPPLLVFFVGTVVGILAFSRVLSYLLARYYHQTVALLVGFMLGALWKIYPWKNCVSSDLDRHGDFRCLAEENILPDFGSDAFVLAVVLAIGGFVLVNLLDHLQAKDNLLFRRVWK